MVEFLYVAPVLALLLGGTFQFALIYHAKTTLNYAAFETARAGALNNARMWAMELAFARAMAPLYTTPYVALDDSGTCTTTWAIGAAHSTAPALSHVACARERVRSMLTDHVRILLVNPGPDSFDDHGPDDVPGITFEYIPNDNLMYRSSRTDGISRQSIQDANLIKVHVSFCYELIVPVVDRFMAALVREAPTQENPWNFGTASGFQATCTAAAGDPPRYGIPIHAQAVMRMQTDPIRDVFCGGNCTDAERAGRGG